MGISNFQTIIGLLNGMIGGTILILPLLGIVVGYMSVVFITVVIAMISGYTAFLIVKHLGTAPNIKEAILDHFDGDTRYAIAYNTFISLTFFPAFFGYFHLLVLQLKGLFHIDSWILPLTVFILLFALTLFLKNYQLGQKLLAYGIISIIGYIIFLIWALASAPAGPQKVQPVGNNYVNFSAVLMFAFSIHDFVVQVLIHNPNRRQYTKLIIWTYVLGTIAYIFMGLGSFSIINRQSINQNPQVIQEFFALGQWQVTIIQALYTIHLLSALPQYVLISKVRMMQAFGYQQKSQTLQPKQIVYIFVAFFLSYIMYVMDVKIAMLLQIGGAIMGFVYIIVIPIGIHFKCVYYDQASGFLEDDPQFNQQIVQHQCQCDVRYTNKITKNMEILWMAFTIAVGLYITIFTLHNIFFQKNKHK